MSPFNHRVRGSHWASLIAVALCLVVAPTEAASQFVDPHLTFDHGNNPPMPPHMAQEPMLKKTVGYGDLWDGFGESFGMQGQLETPPSDPLPSPGALPLLAAAALLTGRRRRASLRPGFIR